ncbi:MAG: hypothetical protein FJW35_11985 [Acidobacteria bacterium]|nr:hypothetical protein [Acidobacteriota bacterium]
MKEIRALLPRLRDKAGQDDAESFLRKKLAPAEQGAAAPPPAPAAKAAAPRLGEGRPGPGLLDSILDQSGAPGAPPAGIADRALEQWVQEIMAPHRILVDAAREETLRSKLNRLLSVQVNAVLHQPGFQRLESAWRSLYRMVRNVETGPRLQIRIVQLEKDEILSDVLSGRRLEDSELACTMVDRTSVAGSDRPTLLVGDYEFSAGLEDMAVLERLGILAARMGATFVAGAAPEMVGRNSFEVLGTPADLERLFRDDAYGPWRLLRKSGAARRLALGLPRVLCRLPYGPDCDPAETFDFREDILGLRHERLLWGNPAYLVASVYAAAFSAHGWQRDPATTVPKVDGLPLYLRRSDGETVAQPCAEVLLTERMAESLMEAGFLPLVSHRGTDVVSLPSLQTIADPRRPIRWNGD